MTNPIYRKFEFVGTSRVSMEDAVANAVAHAARNGHKVDWFEIVETRGAVKDGEITQFQVIVKLGCRTED